MIIIFFDIDENIFIIHHPYNPMVYIMVRLHKVYQVTTLIIFINYFVYNSFINLNYLILYFLKTKLYEINATKENGSFIVFYSNVTWFETV